MSHFISFHLGMNNEAARGFESGYAPDSNGEYANPAYHGARMDAPELLPSGGSHKTGWLREAETVRRDR